MTPVKSCDAGTVIYKGKIPGRGLVVLIRHKHEYLSLYANLEESDLNNLTLGKNIEAGETLGTVKDKLYFEMRRNGESLEPSLLFSSKQTERLKETKL
jgi:septal ring factor EnvC (AmiA/AmiB activator)